MSAGGWMRVLDTMGGLAELAGRVVGGRAETSTATGAGASGPGGALGPLGQIEARLTGVLVAALKEAFERDGARLELERTQQEAEERRREAEQRRLDEALKAELRRQAVEARRHSVDRALAQLRSVAVLAVGAWALSAVLVVTVPGMRDDLPRLALGVGWLCAIAAVATVVAASQRLTRWAAGPEVTDAAPPHDPIAIAAPWLLVGAFTAIAASLLVAL